MPRPKRPLPPMFTHREVLQILVWIGLFVFLIVSMDRIRNPASWKWVVSQEETDSALTEDAPAEPGADNAPRPEGLPPAMHAAADVEPTPPDAGAVPQAARGDQLAKGQVNPLNLFQINECTEVDSILLEHVKDKQEVTAEDRTATYQLMCVAATTPPEVRKAKARKDVFYGNLWNDPKTYRGQLIHVEGVCHRCVIGRENMRDSNPYGIDKYWEAWIFPPDQMNNPILLLFTSLPEGFPVGNSIKENVSMDAYFLKLLAFTDQSDTRRGAPELIGYNLVWHPAPTMDLATDAILVIVAVVLLVIAVAGYYWWSSRQDQQLAEQFRAGPDMSADLDFSGPVHAPPTAESSADPLPDPEAEVIEEEPGAAESSQER